MTTSPESHAAGHAHDPHLRHHFHDRVQQYEAAVQGMWLFLATEILLFGGLFCVYAVYRANHPEIFEYAHQYLDKKWGAINTVILLCSSFTMASGVWAAQHGRRGMLIIMLVLTLLGGCGFLGVKYVEYEHKWKEGLLWGKFFQPQHAGAAFANHAAAEHATGAAPAHVPAGSAATTPATVPSSAPTTGPASPASAPRSSTATTQPDPSWVFRPSDIGPRGLLRPGQERPGREPSPAVRNVQTFFGVYFAMTGLHGLHVIAGLVVISWILVGSVRGQFGAGYYTPVHLVGLYWHVVDLIWIYLFPLLYLIH